MIHSSIVGHLGCFQNLVVLNSTVINIAIQVSLLYPFFMFFWVDAQKLYDCMVWNLHIVFHNGCTNLHSHHQCVMVPVSPHPHQHLLLVLPLILAIVTGVKWNLSVVLIYIAFITRKYEQFFMYLLIIFTSSFENSQFNSCATFFIGMLILWRLSFLSSL
jgi:hypothetical protein